MYIEQLLKDNEDSCSTRHEILSQIEFIELTHLVRCAKALLQTAPVREADVREAISSAMTAAYLCRHEPFFEKVTKNLDAPYNPNIEICEEVNNFHPANEETPEEKF